MWRCPPPSPVPSPSSSRRESSGFRQVLGRLEEQPVCQRQPLKSFLVLPFQRITRLRILLEVRLCPTGVGFAHFMLLWFPQNGPCMGCIHKRERHHHHPQKIAGKG